MLIPEKECYRCAYRHKLWFELPCKNCNGNPDTYPDGTDNFTPLDSKADNNNITKE